MDRNYDVINVNLRRPRVAIFADIIKIVTMFIKAIFKNSRKVKRIRNYVSNCNLFLHQNSRGVLRDSYIFGPSLGPTYNCAKFHQCRICVTVFIEVGLFAPLHP